MSTLSSRMDGPAVPVAASCLILAAALSAGGMEVEMTQNTDKLMPYQVLELTFRHEGNYQDPTWDVAIDVNLRSPSGKKHTVGGFFYGSTKPQKPVIKETGGRPGGIATWPCDPADLWKARYAPGELGRWKFDYVFRGPNGERATGSGEFQVVPGRAPQKGFLRINPQNPFRFVFDDGSPYFPIGFQDGIFDNNHNGSVMDVCAVEGPFRKEGGRSLRRARCSPADPRWDRSTATSTSASTHVPASTSGGSPRTIFPSRSSPVPTTPTRPTSIASAGNRPSWSTRCC